MTDNNVISTHRPVATGNLKQDLIKYCDYWSIDVNSDDVCGAFNNFNSNFSMVKICDFGVNENLVRVLFADWQCMETQRVFPDDEYDQRILASFISSIKAIIDSI